MRKTLMLSAFVVAVLAAPALFADDGATGVQWMHDYAKAKAAGAESGKRIFIEFTAEW